MQWPHGLTVETLRNRQIVAHCHGETYASDSDFDFRVDVWRYSDSETWA